MGRRVEKMQSRSVQAASGGQKVASAEAVPQTLRKAAPHGNAASQTASTNRAPAGCARLQTMTRSIFSHLQPQPITILGLMITVHTDVLPLHAEELPSICSIAKEKPQEKCGERTARRYIGNRREGTQKTAGEQIQCKHRGEAFERGKQTKEYLGM